MAQAYLGPVYILYNTTKRYGRYDVTLYVAPGLGIMASYVGFTRCAVGVLVRRNVLAGAVVSLAYVSVTCA